MKVRFLGTGNAFGSGGRHSVSILIRSDGFGVLLDCGAACLPMMKRHQHSVLEVDLVLITHHHGDHFSGIPFLLLDYRYETGRAHPLTIAGPPGTEEKIRKLGEILFPGLEAKPSGYELSYRELDSRPARLGPVEVHPFRVRHAPEGIALGYRLEWADRAIVYTGDTEWTDEIASQSHDADLLICECSTFQSKIPYHLSCQELLTHLDRMSARRTLLVHAGEDVLAQRTELPFELAEEGQEVHL